MDVSKHPFVLFYHKVTLGEGPRARWLTFILLIRAVLFVARDDAFLVVRTVTGFHTCDSWLVCAWKAIFFTRSADVRGGRVGARGRGLVGAGVMGLG